MKVIKATSADIQANYKPYFSQCTQPIPALHRQHLFFLSQYSGWCATLSNRESATIRGVDVIRLSGWKSWSNFLKNERPTALVTVFVLTNPDAIAVENFRSERFGELYYIKCWTKSNHGGIIEEEIYNSFFFLRFLFIWANLSFHILMIS